MSGEQRAFTAVAHPERIPATSAEGWLRTGDIAHFRPDGYMRLVDRKKDLVKSGGEWISSVDMENALCNHPAVAEAAVIAVADPRWGERPLAIVVLHPGHPVDAEGIRTHLLELYPEWIVPEHIEFVPQMPRTGVGKLNKLALRHKFN